MLSVEKGTILRQSTKEWIAESGSLFIDIPKRLNYHLRHRCPKEVKSMQGYCVKCRSKKEIKDAKAITMKNGKPATRGTCPSCGTKMFRIGKA